MQRIPDFRKARGQRYKLYNLLIISILAFLAGADDFEGIAAFARQKSKFLIQEGLMKEGRIPSHDLFRWIFMRIDKNAFSTVLSTWLGIIIENTQLAEAQTPSPPRIIRIDGKSLRASRRAEHTRTALQVVSAFVGATHLTLEQLVIDDKSCEKTAIPLLINLLDLKNSVVSIDAVATYAKNAKAIVDKEGDYILALKKNNKLFFLEVESFFHHFKDTALISHSIQQTDKGHGRIESRTCRIISELKHFPDAADWQGLRSLVCIESERTIGGKKTTENRFYLSSLQPDAAQLQELIRGHWDIENKLHWSLDVAFNEDKHRLREKNAAFCCTMLRRFCLTLIKNVKILKDSVKSQRLQIAWNEHLLKQYLELL